MLKIIENDIYRGSTKIGYVQDNDVFDSRGSKVGYFSDNDIYGRNGMKLGYIEANELIASDGRKIRVDEIKRNIEGGSISDTERAAIYLLIGD